jgi:putative membrane protein
MSGEGEPMIELLVHVFVTAALLLLVARIIDGVSVESWGSAFLAAIVLGLVNAVVRPFMVMLTLPITAVTFGLFLFVVNALMLWLVAALVPGVSVKGFTPALLGSLLLSILNTLIGLAFGVV